MSDAQGAVALRMVAEIPMWRPLSKEFGGNARQHPFARARLAKLARKKVGDALMVAGWPRELPPGRFTLTFRVECAHGVMPDSDNQVSVLKEVRDSVAAWLSTTDAPTGPIRWKYAYRSGPTDRVVMVLEDVV